MAEEIEVDPSILEGLLASCQSEPIEEDTAEIGIQTRLPLKRKKPASAQTDMPSTSCSTPSPAPVKKPKIIKAKKRKTYSTAEKIHSVRRFEESLASGMSKEMLNKWKDKIKNYLFQAQHVERQFLNKGKISKFFSEIDENMMWWYKKNSEKGGDSSEVLRKKAQFISRIDEEVSVVSDAWIEEFKKKFDIS